MPSFASDWWQSLDTTTGQIQAICLGGIVLIMLVLYRRELLRLSGVTIFWVVNGVLWLKPWKWRGLRAKWARWCNRRPADIHLSPEETEKKTRQVLESLDAERAFGEPFDTGLAVLMRCRFVTHHVERYIVGSLSRKQQVVMRRHIADCRVCCAYARGFKRASGNSVARKEFFASLGLDAKRYQQS